MPAGQQLLIVDIPMGSKEFEEVERNVKLAPRNTIKEILKVRKRSFQTFLMTVSYYIIPCFIL